MSLHIIQSHTLSQLVQYFFAQFQQAQANDTLFDTQHIITPNPAVKQWILQHIARQQGICANIQWHTSIHEFKWTSFRDIKNTPDHKEKVRNANLPRLVIKWRVYHYLLSQFTLYKNHAEQFIDSPLSPIFQRILNQAQYSKNQQQAQGNHHDTLPLEQQQMIYWFADQTARVFGNYLTHRMQWLNQWSGDCVIAVEDELNKYAANNPFADKEIEKAQEIERWQRHLWHTLFKENFSKIIKVERAFWETLKEQGENHQLPKSLFIFTLLDLAPSQLNFLKRLALHIDIYIFHFSPTQEYWADSVDPRWKLQHDLKIKQRIRKKYPKLTEQAFEQLMPAYQPELNAEHYEARHPLLTRFGKQARDHFSLLSEFSGGELGEWIDAFDDAAGNEPTFAPNLLGQLQSDIFYLLNPEAGSHHLQDDDTSIQIHVCHSPLRQLEVLKERLLHWLNDGDGRQPQDILVLTPNLTQFEPYIRTVFSQSKLPFQLAGTTPLHIRNAWRMFSYRIIWPTTRFYFDDFIDWLYLPATQACYDLDASKISRIKDLLQQAGFKRGFDHEHLQETPSAKDQDFRFSFLYAVDRLAMGLAVPLTTLCPTEFGTQSQHDEPQGIISFNHISRDDTVLIQILLRIASDFKLRRTWLNDNEKTVIEWLAILIKDIDQLRENNKVAHLEQVRNIVKKYDTMLSMSEYDKDKKEKTESVLAQLKIPLLDLVQDIQQQLENQVEQASITGAITFSQIGQIRPLPYQLIVLLNLDQGVFPQRDHPLAFDLMHILPSKIGDRSRLEDHKGAFLDAILQAQQNLWLFYTGFDADSHEVLEPSSIVQEFLQHLAHLLDQTDTADHATINAQGLEIYQALERLYYIHPAEPFVPQGFQQTRITRYENEWFQIAKQLQHGTQQQQIAQSWFDVTEQAPAHHEPTAQQFLTLDAETWIKDLRFPARILLKQLKINNQKSYSEHDLFEPLIPNHLDQFKILAQLLPAIYDNDFDEKNTSYQLDTELPVGKMKMVVKAQQEQWVAKFQQRLDDLQLQITATSNVSWQVPTDIAQGLYGEHIVLQMQLPHKDVQQWCQIQGSNSSAKYRLAAWLRHILWLSALNLGERGHDYTSYLMLKDVTLRHTGISSNEAQTYLTEWFEAYHYAQKQPLVLPVELVIKHALKDYKDEDFDFEKSLSLATTEWFNTYAKFKNNEENENRLTHLDWQFLLQDLDSEHLLRQSLDQFIQLYCTLLDHEQQVN